MCKNDSFAKPRCLICFEEICEMDLYHLVKETKICFKCMKKFALLEKKYTIENYPTTILYHYNDFFKECLYHYKGLGDIALAPVFFHRHDFKEKYKDHVVVCIPSLQKENDIRHFAPMEELAKVFSNQLFLGLYKKEDMKQAVSKDRTLVKNNFGIHHGELLKDKKVLIFDDVYTSGTTLTSCLHLVENVHPSSIEILILSLSPKSTLKEDKVTLKNRILPFIEKMKRLKE